MPPRIPRYRRRPDRDLAFAEHRNVRTYFPGRYDSPESRAAYNRWLRAILGEEPADPVITGSPGQATVGDLVLAFLNHAKIYHLQDGKAGSEYHCLRAASLPLLTVADSILASHFGPKDLKAVRAEMVRRGWSRNTVNDQVGRIRRIFRWGVEHELVPAALLEGLRAVAPLKRGRTTAAEAVPIRPVDDAIVAATLPYLTPTLAAMVRLQQVTGMRPQDVCRLRPCDVDRSADVWLYRPPAHKGTWRESDRIVAIGPKAQAILGPYLDRPNDAYCFSASESKQQRHAARRAARKSKLTPSQAARRPKAKPANAPRSHYDSASYRRAIAYAIRKARDAGQDVPDWHPNQLRHGVGTQVRAKYGLEAAQVYLGHARADVTEIYAERDLDRARQIAREMG